MGLIKKILLFSLLLPLNSASQEIIKVENFKITILSTMFSDTYIGEWGFSALIEADGKRILFDTGSRGNTVFRNAKELNINLEFTQSNIEGEIVTIIQDARKKYDGIIINAAGFTHTSVSIRDALDIFKKPIIEIHISNIYKREEFRQKSLISDIVTGGIFGLGADGYILAIISMQKLIKK